MTGLEWQMMRSIADVRDQLSLARIVEGFDFSGYGRAQSMVLEAFELTAKNVKLHTAAAIKIAGFNECSGLKSAYRLAVLRAMVADVTSQSFTSRLMQK